MTAQLTDSLLRMCVYARVLLCVATRCDKIEDHTIVSFKPDLTRFTMQSLRDDDILDVMTMRVYDIAGCNESLKVPFMLLVDGVIIYIYIHIYT